MAEIAITATAVLGGTSPGTQTVTLAAGVTVTQGQALYQLAAGTYGLADSNGTTPANSFAGFALSAGSPGQQIVMLVSQKLTAGGYICGGTVASGDTIWLGNTPGAITKTYSDVASGSTVIPIGVVNTDLSMQVVPLVGGVK